MSTIKGIFYVFIQVSSLARTRRFYADKLGWKLGTNEKDVCGFAFGGGYLVAHKDTRPKPERTYGGGMSVAVQVDDIEAAHKELKRKKVKVSPILDQHWGERQFYFTDPDGYAWSYGQQVGGHH